jgi:hypothetical protein
MLNHHESLFDQSQQVSSVSAKAFRFGLRSVAGALGGQFGGPIIYYFLAAQEIDGISASSRILHITASLGGLAVWLGSFPPCLSGERPQYARSAPQYARFMTPLLGKAQLSHWV